MSAKHRAHPAALALTVALAAARPALAAPLTLALQDPALRFTLPDGFRAQPGFPRGPFVAAAASPDRVVVMVRRLGGELAQAPLDARTRAALRSSDPWPCPDDTLEPARALGLTLATLRCEATTPGARTPVVRFVVALPLEREAVALLVLAPRASEPAARRALGAALATLEARASWRSPLARALERLAGAGAVAALALSLLSVLGALGARGRAKRLRGALLASAGVAWALPGAWFVLRADRAGVAIGLALLAVAVVAIAQGLGALRAGGTATKRSAPAAMP